MVNESHYSRMPLFKALAAACLSPSLCPPRSLSLPPRWSSQLGWMRLIFHSSCANAFLSPWECSMHPNLRHCLVYFFLEDCGALFAEGKEYYEIMFGFHYCFPRPGSSTAGFTQYKINPAVLTKSAWTFAEAWQCCAVLIFRCSEC